MGKPVVKMSKPVVKDWEAFSQAYPNTIRMDGFDDAVIGIDINDRLVYSYSKIADLMVATGNVDCEEACEFIDFNIIRGLPYLGDRAPIIMMDIDY